MLTGLDIEELESIVEVNTIVGRPPLCPELKLRFLKEDAPLKQTAPTRQGEPHIFDWNGPRPYWAFAWASGQALARFILDNPEFVWKKHVLDFGAGSGIAGIAAAKAGAATVVAIDIDPTAIQAIQINARLNDVFIAAKRENMAECTEKDWNVILAGDAFYWGRDSDAMWLLDWAAEDQLILIGDPQCRGFPKAHLEKLASYPVRTFPGIEDSSLQEACVYRLIPNCKPCEGALHKGQ